MVDSIGINRVPSNEERQDYNQLGTKSPNTLFLKKLSEVHAGFTKNHKPFGAQCAKLDYLDLVEKTEKESLRKWGFVRQSDVFNLKVEDLEKYGNQSRFTIEADDEEIEMQNVNNTKTAVIVGHTVKYVCKERNHGCSVFIPLELYKERFEKKSNKKEE